MGRRLSIAASLLALVPAGAAAASAHAASGKPAQTWAAAEISTVTAAGLMGATGPADFRPADDLTAQTLEDLVFGLKQTVSPPAPVPPPADPSVPSPSVPSPSIPNPSGPAPTVPGTTTATAPTTTTAPATTTAPTVTTPVPVPTPGAPRRAANPDAPVTMAQLD
ncbi:MAG: hypothetical protein QOF75_1986, partial [Gaiellaceae bacterium]|nr:hypothetical protein [Gaiellaceae bacterium]